MQSSSRTAFNCKLHEEFSRIFLQLYLIHIFYSLRFSLSSLFYHFDLRIVIFILIPNSSSIKFSFSSVALLFFFQTSSPFRMKHRTLVPRFAYSAYFRRKWMHANTTRDIRTNSRGEGRAAGMRSDGRIKVPKRRMRATGIPLRWRVAMRRWFGRGQLPDRFTEEQDAPRWVRGTPHCVVLRLQRVENCI